MAYIPPHKRHSKDPGGPSPTPELLVPRFKRNLNLRSADSKVDRSGKIIYSKHAISRWFAVGLVGDGSVPSCIRLEPISLEAFECRSGEKPLILVSETQGEDNSKLEGNHSKSQWVAIAENVLEDLYRSFEFLKNEMELQGLETVKPSLVARFGKILFRGSPTVRLANVDKNEVKETVLRQLKRSFYTNITSSYMENILDVVVPRTGLDFEEEKDVYHVKLYDNRRRDATVSCKCSVKEDGKLLVYKVELNAVRQMVTDISCLNKNLDLRLMLCSKRILTALTDDEMSSIRDLVNSAVLDPEVKGGLKWPLGKTSSGDRYSVVGVWHLRAKAYKNPSVRLKVRHADRYDFRTGTGEATREIILVLKGIVSEMQEQKAGSDSVPTMLKDSLRIIWEYFLSCDRFLT